MSYDLAGFYKYSSNLGSWCQVKEVRLTSSGFDVDAQSGTGLAAGNQSQSCIQVTRVVSSRKLFPVEGKNLRYGVRGGVSYDGAKSCK